MTLPNVITIRLHIPARPAAGGEEEGKRKVVSRQATPHLDTDRAVVVAMAHEQGQKNWAGDLLRSHRSGHVRLMPPCEQLHERTKKWALERSIV